MLKFSLTLLPLFGGYRPYAAASVSLKIVQAIRYRLLFPFSSSPIMNYLPLLLLLSESKNMARGISKRTLATLVVYICNIDFR